MYLLPICNAECEIHDGTFIQAMSFCKCHSREEKCKKFYQSLTIISESGFHKCPYGLVTYVHCENLKKIVFTSLREYTLYTKKNKKFVNEKVYNPVLTQKQLLSLIEISVTRQSEKDLIKDKIDSFDAMAHEVKKLNSQIKEHCDSLINLYSEKNDYMSLTPEEYSSIFEKIKTLYIISNMINSRYAIYDYDKNPDSLISASKIRLSIHGKFLKCSKILKNYKKKNIFIDFEGETHKKLEAYSSFEMIPFLILENALKYSLNDSKINVKFIDTFNSLTIEIISDSLYCSQDDIPHIFEKNYRGKNAKKISDGSGIGLFFVKLLCDLHNITICATSDSTDLKELNDSPYAQFKVELKFNELSED